MPKKFGKHVAAFANSYGGKIYLGIKTDNKENVPTDIPGIDIEEGIKEKIKNIIRDTVNPMPLFKIDLVKKPKAKNKGVLVVSVEESPSPQYLVSDGKIYIRNAVGSDPVPATDSYTVDRLYQKGERQKEFRGLALNNTTWRRALISRPEALTIICCPLNLKEELIPNLFAKDNKSSFQEVLLSVWPGRWTELRPRQHSLVLTEGEIIEPFGPTGPVYVWGVETYCNGLIELYDSKAFRNGHVREEKVMEQCKLFINLCEKIYSDPGTAFEGTVSFIVGLNGHGKKLIRPPGQRGLDWEYTCYLERVEITKELSFYGLTEEYIDEQMDDIRDELVRCFEVHYL